jgi:hypothetical protein
MACQEFENRPPGTTLGSEPLAPSGPFVQADEGAEPMGA